MNCESCDDPKKVSTTDRDRAGVDQKLRRDVFLILQREPLADRAGHARQSDRKQVGHQLADGAGAAVAEMVDIVGEAFVVDEADQVAG